MSAPAYGDHFSCVKTALNFLIVKPQTKNRQVGGRRDLLLPFAFLPLFVSKKICIAFLPPVGCYTYRRGGLTLVPMTFSVCLLTHCQPPEPKEQRDALWHQKAECAGSRDS
jgi:hypothetical protein